MHRILAISILLRGWCACSVIWGWIPNGRGNWWLFSASWFVSALIGVFVWINNTTCSNAMVFGEDDRQPQSYHDMYNLKSVGIVVAGRYVGVGTLVVRGDIMVTSAHVIYDEFGRLRSREVTYFPDGNPQKKVRVDIDHFSVGNRRVKPGQMQHDWIILRLTKDVLANNTNQGFTSAGILPVTSVNFDQLKDNIVHVSFDFRRRPYRKLVNRKCHLHRKSPGDMFWGIPSILLHDCDLGRRDNSGSPIFYFKGGRYYLVGLHQGGHKDFYGSAFNPVLNPNFAYGITKNFEKAAIEFLQGESAAVSAD